MILKRTFTRNCVRKIKFYYQSYSVMNSLNALSHFNYSQSIKIDIGPADGGTIVLSTHNPTVLY